MVKKDRSIYRKPEGDPVSVAVEQYKVTEDAFFYHQKQVRLMDEILHDLDDDQYEEYMKRTQP